MFISSETNFLKVSFRRDSRQHLQKLSLTDYKNKPLVILDLGANIFVSEQQLDNVGVQFCPSLVFAPVIISYLMKS